MGLGRIFLGITRSLREGINHLKRKIKPGVTFMSQDPAYKNYQIGKFTYGCPRIIKYHKNANLKIGNFCSIAEEVKIFLGGEHFMDKKTTYPLNTIFRKKPLDEFSKGDVVIGNDVWIGHGATILSGVSIGDGAVIGAESVVAKSVDPYSVVVGNPGKMVKKRFDKQTIKKLLKMRWWDWEEERILKNIDFLLAPPEDFK